MPGKVNEDQTYLSYYKSYYNSPWLPIRKKKVLQRTSIFTGASAQANLHASYYQVKLDMFQIKLRIMHNEEQQKMNLLIDES